MIIKPILIFIVSLANIILGILILRKNIKNPSNIFYFLMCLTGGSWGLVKSFQLVATNVYLHDILITKLIYIFGMLAPLAYLMLAYNFPYKLKEYSKKLIYFIYLLPIFLIFLVIIGLLKMQNVSIINNQVHLDVILRDFIIFAIYFFIYIFCGAIILLKKYLTATDIYKYQIKYLIIATLATFLTTGIVSVILLIFNNFTYDWLGPIFMLIHFIIAGYLIFYRPSKIK